MKISYDYWKVQGRTLDGHTDYTYEKTAIWQCAPFNAIPITKEQYEAAIKNNENSED